MNDNIEVRRVKIDDDFTRIAELIYETDPYIYPYWFHDDIEEAKRVLPPLMKEEGFFFNYKSMYIAVDKNTKEILGFVCLVTNDTNLDYDYEPLRNVSETYKFTIDNYIMELIREVKDFQLPYVSNVAVYHTHRGKKIGSIMLEKVIEDNKNKYKKFLLDVLSENPSAIRLYEKMGFTFTSDEVMGLGYGPDSEVGQYSMELDVDNTKKM